MEIFMQDIVHIMENKFHDSFLKCHMCKYLEAKKKHVHLNTLQRVQRCSVFAIQYDGILKHILTGYSLFYGFTK